MEVTVSDKYVHFVLNMEKMLAVILYDNNIIILAFSFLRITSVFCGISVHTITCAYSWELFDGSHNSSTFQLTELK